MWVYYIILQAINIFEKMYVAGQEGAGLGCWEILIAEREMGWEPNVKGGPRPAAVVVGCKDTSEKWEVTGKISEYYNYKRVVGTSIAVL